MAVKDVKKLPVLLGIKHFISSKNGKEYYVLQLSVPFLQRDLNQGCVGCRVEEKFIPEDLYGDVFKLQVGKPIQLSYDVVGDKAYIDGFQTVE